jgi:hypothetical protein
MLLSAAVRRIYFTLLSKFNKTFIATDLTSETTEF